MKNNNTILIHVYTESIIPLRLEVSWFSNIAKFTTNISKVIKSQKG